MLVALLLYIYCTLVVIVLQLYARKSGNTKFSGNKFPSFNYTLTLVNKFGQNIRHLRAKNRISQDTFAKIEGFLSSKFPDESDL